MQKVIRINQAEPYIYDGCNSSRNTAQTKDNYSAHCAALLKNPTGRVGAVIRLITYHNPAIPYTYLGI